MTQFGEWLKNPSKRSNIELFTGYMTSSRFVISLIEYYHSMEEGPKKALLKKFLDGRIESKLLSSTAVSISKTKENIQAITDWIEKNQNDPNVF
jgi:phosphopantetheinyl transferase (holo-ACP synthase)